MTIDEPVQEPPIPPAAPKPEASIPVRKLVIGLVGVVVTLAVGWFGWSQYTAREDAARTAEVSLQVKELMQEKLDSNPDNEKYGVEVDEVLLFRESDMKYTGMVKLHSAKSSERQIPVEVTADGSKVMYQLDDSSKGTFMALLGLD
jgi:hypothetical protein